jgi:hypothetical protein
MELYESYLDEDLEEDYDESESYNDEDYDEDYDEADGEYGEVRRRRRRPIRARVNRRGRNSIVRRPRRGAVPAKVTSSNVKNAFRNVGDDVNRLKGKLKNAETKQSTEQINDALTLLAFRPKPILEELKAPLETKTGTFVASVATGINDNILPQLLVKVFGNTGGPVQKYLPFFLGALVLFPDLISNLNLGGTKSSSTSKTATSGSLAGLDPGLLLILVAIFLLTKKK